MYRMFHFHFSTLAVCVCANVFVMPCNFKWYIKISVCNREHTRDRSSPSSSSASLFCFLWTTTLLTQCREEIQRNEHEHLSVHTHTHAQTYDLYASDSILVFVVLRMKQHICIDFFSLLVWVCKLEYTRESKQRICSFWICVCVCICFNAVQVKRFVCWLLLLLLFFYFLHSISLPNKRSYASVFCVQTPHCNAEANIRKVAWKRRPFTCTTKQ